MNLKHDNWKLYWIRLDSWPFDTHPVVRNFDEDHLLIYCQNIYPDSGYWPLTNSYLILISNYLRRVCLHFMHLSIIFRIPYCIIKVRGPMIAVNHVFVFYDYCGQNRFILSQGWNQLRLIYAFALVNLQLGCVFVTWSHYRSGTVNSNTVNSKFHLIRSFFEIFATFLLFHV